MEDKKTKKADVDKNSGIFRDAGVVAAMLLLVLAFTWERKEPELELLESNITIFEEEEIADVTQEEKKPPPPPPPPVIEVVEDDEVIEEDQPELEEVDIDDDFEVEIEEFEEFEEKEAKIFVSVEKLPEPNGGWATFYKWLGENIKYPALEREMGIEGKVIVQFVVEPDGGLTQVKLYPGTEEENTKAMNDAALSVLEKSPKWSPGRQGGEAVRVRYQIPVKFQLSGR